MRNVYLVYFKIHVYLPKRRHLILGVNVSRQGVVNTISKTLRTISAVLRLNSSSFDIIE